MTDIELRQVAKKIWPQLAEGKCVAWIGAGLSRGADYPGWKETVDRLCSACGVTSLDASDKESADRLIDKAEECKKADPTNYRRTLAELFGRAVGPTRHAFNLLMRLPFLSYVTTNFDPLLSTAGAAYGYYDLYCYPSLPVSVLGGNSHPIFYIHGLARHGSSSRGYNLVLARSDFDSAYEDPGIVRSFLTQLLTYHSVLFIGCSLAEPSMHYVFRRVNKIHKQIQREHPGSCMPLRYALLPTRTIEKVSNGARKVSRDTDMELEERARLQDMDIQVLRYEPTDRHHREIEEILEELCELAKIRVSPSPRSGLGEELPS